MHKKLYTDDTLPRTSSRHRRAYRQNSPSRLMRLGTVCVLLFLAGLATNQFLSQLQQCANSITCRQPLVEQIDNTSLATFMGRTLVPPKINGEEAADAGHSRVLGDTDDTQSKHIYIDLDRQMLFAFEGTQQVQSALISSGRWGWTPVGNYNIQSKFKATRMSGGSGSDYYNLPNVPYTMFFNGDFGIHGAYWHNNFGTPMSHGCVNMRTVDAQALFEWADGPTKGVKGTAVSVCQSFTAPDGCIQDQKVHMPVPNTLPPEYAAESNAQVSADGTKTVVVSSRKLSPAANVQTISVLDSKTGDSKVITSQALDASVHINVPYNSWSPNNAYFYIEHRTADGSLVDVQVFKASESYDATKPLLSAKTAFEKKQTTRLFDRATGWASNTLLIVNSIETSDMSKGPSFWYEVPSQAVIQLSQRF